MIASTFDISNHFQHDNSSRTSRTSSKALVSGIPAAIPCTTVPAPRCILALHSRPVPHRSTFSSLLLCSYRCPQSSEHPSDLGCAWIARKIHIHHTRPGDQVMPLAHDSQPPFPRPAYCEMGEHRPSVGTPSIGTSNLLFVPGPEGTSR